MILAVQINSTNQIACVFSDDNELIVIWDEDTQDTKATIRTINPVVSMACNDNLLVVVHRKGVSVINLANNFSKKEHGKFDTLDDCANLIDFGKKTFVVPEQYGVCFRASVKTGGNYVSSPLRLAFGSSVMRCLALSPSGSYLGVADNQGNKLHVMNVKRTSETYALWRGYNPSLAQSICFSHDDKCVAMHSSSGSCHVYPIGGQQSVIGWIKAKAVGESHLIIRDLPTGPSAFWFDPNDATKLHAIMSDGKHHRFVLDMSKLTYRHRMATISQKKEGDEPADQEEPEEQEEESVSLGLSESEGEGESEVTVPVPNYNFG